jgi:branched-chain amino acid transport system substrate-binding protein
MRWSCQLVVLLIGVLPAATAAGEKSGPGVSATEIRIGNTNPYSGPASSYGIIGKVQAAYFQMINERGGIHGRKINFISYDDGYSPPKTVEQTRKLVEADNVLLVFSSIGTATSMAVQKYLNSRQVPQLFVGSGSGAWGNFRAFPWSVSFQPSFDAEGRIFARYILATRPEARIGVLYQNDDLGRDLLKGLKDGLGPRAANIVIEEPYEVNEPTVDSLVLRIKASDVDVFVDFSSPKQAAQAIRKIGEIGWRPVHLLTKVSASVAAVMKPAGYDNAQGVISAAFSKEPGDPQWRGDPAMRAYEAFVERYLPGSDKNNTLVVYGYLAAESLRYVLEACGDDLTRQNVIHQATSMNNVAAGLLLPGITLNTSPTNRYPIRQLQLMVFEGEGWRLFGPIVSDGE